MLQEMYAGYMWGDHTSWKVAWERPRNTIADASLWLIAFETNSRPHAEAWVRSVTVRDPVTGAVTEKPSDGAVPVRIESNAVAVIFGLNVWGGTGPIDEAEGLVHLYWSS